ncbi:MAG: hypothetical protein IIZ55_05555 [Firmicutes bacterium]|nr:hypothetical protein [Bacillota bacterium]MBQ1888150.1 hypothetical protein [Bacillota bacterium]
MRTVIDLNSRAEALKNAISICSGIIRRAPKGTLRCQFTHGSWRYYRSIDPADPSDSVALKRTAGRYKYLKANELHIAARLAEKEHAIKLKKLCEAELASIEQYLKAADPSALSGYLEKLSPGRKALLEPVCDLDSILGKAWSEPPDQRLSPFEGNLRFRTKRGELVRSKSELIIANYLYDHGHHYQYETALHLASRTIYPDFTIRTKGGDAVYWEHAGMLDNTGYGEDLVKKLNDYARDGIIPGRDLIISFETQAQPLRTEIIEAIAEYYLG